MKHIVRTTLGGLCLAAAALPASAQLPTTPMVKGPSTTTTPYQYPTIPGAQIVSVLTVGDTVGGYRMAGIPDGIGAWDNGNGTWTLLCNHEIGNGNGAIRAHGSKGAFVSKWTITKNTGSMQVLSGNDLTQRVHLYNPSTGTWTAYSTSNPLPAATAGDGLGRFCSGDVPAVSAFYNAATGAGTQERFMMNGEETGTEGRAFAHLATGPNAGNTYELPHLGKFSWENAVACPRASDTTIVMGMDDGTGGQVYMYVGVKQKTGNEITRAGLVGGKLYAIAVNGLAMESTTNSFPAPNTPFTLVPFDTVQKMTGSTLNTLSVAGGATTFQRPEDGAWDPRNPNDFYFLTTSGTNTPSRMWRLRFTNIGNPALGGTITAVLDGTEGQKMMDNLTIDNNGIALIQEDMGNNVHIGKTWQYNLATDSFKIVLAHDSTRFLSGGANYLTQDEEASGIIDMQEILGAGWYFGVDQIHTSLGLPSSLATEVVERGQMFAFFNPDSYNANAEIGLSGNGNAIPNNAMTPASNNNTDFGTTVTGTVATRMFNITNSGVAPLTISSIGMTGTNASEFTLSGTTLPLTIASGASQLVTVEFKPAAVGLRTAMLNIKSNDLDESNYAVALRGVGLNTTTGIAGLPEGSAAKLYPNPTGDNATVELSLKGSERIQVSLLDLQGRTLLQAANGNYAAGDHKFTLNTASLPAGNYLVELTAGNTVTRTKLVVAH